jgi:thymidine phosphorylase
MDAVDVIRTKRDGHRLTDEQIRWFIKAYTDGDVADEQASALLMAIVWRGMEPDELAVWTAAMIASGERLVLDGLDRPTVDKHSTGGVGDKVSLVLPARRGVWAAVPQLGARLVTPADARQDGVDAGWRASLSNAAIITQLREVGAIIAAAGDELAPADRKLYALRDVTGTVESIPLIASSIMSKKIAEGTESLVLDVKVGTGAFMRSLDDARLLAETMVKLGTAHGVRTTALLTAMDTPLGRSAGNAMEVAEAVEILHGGGPADMIEITLALADEMVALAGLRAEPRRHLSDGSAHEVWRAMVQAQGGDPDAPLPESPNREVVRAAASGYVHRLDALAVGVAAWRLGAGRSRKEDPVSPVAGVVCLAKPGDAVVVDEPVLELHVDDPERLASALAALDGAITVGPEPPAHSALVIDTIRA